MAKIIGLGGIFFKAKSPLELANWYKQHLGLDTLAWGGAIFPWDNRVKANAFNIWAPMEKTTDYFAPSQQNFMINFVVDNLEELVSSLQKQNLAINDIQVQEQGKFAWIIDPDGNKVELWEPKQ